MGVGLRTTEHPDGARPFRVEAVHDGDGKPQEHLRHRVVGNIELGPGDGPPRTRISPAALALVD